MAGGQLAGLKNWNFVTELRSEWAELTVNQSDTVHHFTAGSKLTLLDIDFFL